MGEQAHYYFFMKVGNSNVFLDYVKQLGGLWVGYDEVAIPSLTKEGLCDKGNEAPDLRYMKIASLESMRSKVRVVSYSKNALNIFEITDDLRYLEAGLMDWTNSALFASFPASWWTTVKEKFDGIGSQKFKNHFFGENGWKLLPVKLVCSIPRETLLAPIDSLSVWQSFNRKTFQPMFTMLGNESMSSIHWLNNFPSLPSLKISTTETLSEGPFGKFVRLYLDAKSSGLKSPFAKISEDDLIKTGFATLNPAQVETLAMHLCHDLGLTVDVGLGKGLDVADVRATARHLADKDSTIDKAIRKLESVGVVFTSSLRNSIQATATLRIQCKARAVNQSQDLGNVLLIAPTGKSEDRKDALSLEKLSQANPNDFPTFFNWLKIILFDLKN